MKIRLAQYTTAILTSITMVIYQAWSILEKIPGEMSNQKQFEIVKQVRNALAPSSQSAWITLGYIVFVLFSQILISAALIATYRECTKCWIPSWRDNYMKGVLFLAIGLFTTIVWNRYLYPQSIAFSDSDLLLLRPLPKVIFGATSVFIALCVAFTIWRWSRRHKIIAIASIFLLFTSYIYADKTFLFSIGAKNHPVSNGNSPDIIIIGIDSLRHDFLPINGFPIESLTPNINAVIANSAYFEDTTTPTARTFVAYMSLVTGQDPIHHGARFNLYPRSTFRRDNTLAWELKKKGYFNAMAIDESRFANFDTSFGFDRVISPPVGVLDFMLGSSFDTVGTNLMLLFLPIRKLATHIYGNRAAYRLYNTADHNQRITELINTSPTQQPFFLIAHYCLPHWPYLRTNILKKESFLYKINNESYIDAPKDYMRALRETDAQVGYLIEQLRENHRLENSIVIVISDHGESLGMKKDDVFDSTKSAVTIGNYGHGGFILSQSQNKVVMGMQRYINNRAQWKSRVISGPASLIDIAPTILDAIGHSENKLRFDGVSLYPALQSSNQNLPDRIRFFESGLRSSAVEGKNIDEQKVAREMGYLYSITSDLRFEIKPSYLPDELLKKQRGAWLGNIGVAAIPASNNGARNSTCWSAINFTQREMRCINFPATIEPEKTLQAATCRYYSNDTSFYDSWCRSPHGRGHNLQ